MGLSKVTVHCSDSFGRKALLQGFLVAELIMTLALLMILGTVFMTLVGSLWRHRTETEHLLQIVTRLQSRYPAHYIQEPMKIRSVPLALGAPKGIDGHIHDHVIKATKPKSIEVSWQEGKKKRTITTIGFGDIA